MEPRYAQNQSLAKSQPPKTSLEAVKRMTTDPKMLARFQDVLGKKAPQFLASVVSAMASNKQLQNATPMSVMGAAMVAATLNLDINPSLGFSAIVPYKKKFNDNGVWREQMEGQFQIMTKGFVQLAIRSGQYRNINVTEVYADEFEGEDIITGEVIMHPVADGFRSKGDSSKIVGYVAYIELVSGFRKTAFWSMEKILNHAKKFSKSWDTKNGRFFKGSGWDSHFEAMCRKTVLKNTLSSWGILSVEMQRAVVSDQGLINDVDNIDDIEYLDNPDNDGEEIEGEVEESIEDPAPAPPEKKSTSKVAPKKEHVGPVVPPEGFEDDSAPFEMSSDEQKALDALWNQ